MVANVWLLDTCTLETCNVTCLSMCISYWIQVELNSSGLSSQWTDDLSLHDPYTYHILNIHSQQPTRWVYEWVDPELYNMC
jgi:hypothetical protein